jgi:hypothetical protein
MSHLLREGSRAVWLCGLSRLIALLIITAGISTGQTPANRTSATYEGTNEDFANPERGFYIQRSFNPARPTADSGALTESDLQAAQERHMTLVRMLYLLRDYREAPIPEELVTRLAADFSRARKAGVKLIPRFSYSSANRPEYAIRFVTDSGWEPAAGANRLRGAVKVDRGVKAAQFSGKQWFQ